MQSLIGKLKWLGILVPVLYVGLLDFVRPFVDPAGPARVDSRLWLMAGVALGSAAFCYVLCRALVSRSEADRQITLAQEQQRLSRELHDDLAQLVASLNLTLAAWQRELATAEPELRQRVRDLHGATEGIYDKVREIICGCHCEGVPGEGLFSAFRACAEEYAARTGIPIQVDLPPDDATPIRGPAAAQLLRIVREALCNIYRHSGASQARITAETTEKDLVVSIADNGRGFHPRSVLAPSKLGLQIMRERAEMVDGSLTITTAPGEGTRITVRTPLGEEKSKWKDQFESWWLTTTSSSARG